MGGRKRDFGIGGATSHLSGMPSILESPIESRAISRVAYDEERRELYVLFHGGKAYTYYGVPLEDYLALSEAESKGRFVNEVIKPRYEFREGAPI